MRPTSIDVIRRYIALQARYWRLTAAQKTTILLSTILFGVVIAVLAIFVLLFVSIGVGHWMAETIAPKAAYLYVAAFYVVLAAVVVIFRRRLIVNPVCRFISKLLVKPPSNEK